MTRNRLIVAGVTALMMCVPIADSQALPMASPSDVGLYPERLGRIEAMFQGLVDSRELAGATVLVGRRGQIAYFKTFGYMDVEARRPMAASPATGGPWIRPGTGSGRPLCVPPRRVGPLRSPFPCGR